MKVEFTCAQCGTVGQQEAGAVNRAHRRGMRLFCSRRCNGLARRVNKSNEQKKEEKRIYDAAYRVKNFAVLKVKKAAWYQATADREKERAHRKANMARHVEYCRQPEYRAKKIDYDRRRRASAFGEYAECHLLLLDLSKECLSRMSRYEIALANGTLSKSRQRRREYEKLISGRP